MLIIEDFAISTFRKGSIKLAQGGDLVRFARFAIPNLVALVAQAAAHLLIEGDAVDELHLALAFRCFAVAQNPNIGENARVIEQLVRQGDNCFQEILFDNRLPDIAFPAARPTRKERRAIKHNRYPRAFIAALHF